MMILRSSPASPFVRKVRIAAGVLGLADKIEVRETDLNDPTDAIRVQNPLGKIPALILDDGTVYYNSRVILEVSRSHRRRRPHHSARTDGAFCRAATAGAVRRHPRCVGPARLRRAATARPTCGCRPGSTARPTRSRAAWRRWKRRPRRSIRRRTSVRSRLPACSAIAICASAAPGATSHPRLIAWHDEFAAQVPAFAATKVAV